MKDMCKEDLLGFRNGRQNIVWALEGIAIWSNLFQKASRLLLKLGEAEVNSYSNNASGVFADLFSPAWSRLAPTEAPLSERFPIIKESIKSESKDVRKLALNACKSGLQMRHFSKIIGPEYQGIRQTPKLWHPLKRDEIFSYFENIWRLILDNLSNLDMDEREIAVDILLDSARDMVSINSMSDLVINTLKDFSEENISRKLRVLKTIIITLRYESENFSQQVNEKLEELKNKIEEGDYHSRLVRFLSMDLIEEKFDSEGNVNPKYEENIQNLAKEGIQNRSLLLYELPWIIREAPSNALYFGYVLGLLDKERLLQENILFILKDSKKTKDLFFIGGYLRALFESNIEEWEKALDFIASENDIQTTIFELTELSGSSNKALDRLLNIANKWPEVTFDFSWLAFGAWIIKIDEERFQNLLDFLLERKKMVSVSVALSMIDRYYLSKDSIKVIPKELTLKVVLNDQLFDTGMRSLMNPMDEFHWERITSKLIQYYPDTCIEIGRKMLSNLGNDGSIVSYGGNIAINTLDTIAQKHPNELWEVIVEILEKNQKSAFWIISWLRGEYGFGLKKQGALLGFPIEIVTRWIDEDEEQRAPLIARAIPVVDVRESPEFCLFHTFLSKYGDLDIVRVILSTNFSSGGWVGPTTSYLRGKIAKTGELKRGESNSIVIKWLDEYIEMLEKDFEREKIREEREP